MSSGREVKESKVWYGSVNDSLQSSINDYDGLWKREADDFTSCPCRPSICVQLGNAVKALASARCLLRSPECSRVYIFLGNLYAAEACCLLNLPEQASEHLLSYISGQNNAYRQEDCEMWHMRKAMDSEEPNDSNSFSLDLDESISRSSPWLLKPEEARGCSGSVSRRY